MPESSKEEKQVSERIARDIKAEHERVKLEEDRTPGVRETANRLQNRLRKDV